MSEGRKTFTCVRNARELAESLQKNADFTEETLDKLISKIYAVRDYCNYRKDHSSICRDILDILDGKRDA